MKKLIVPLLLSAIIFSCKNDDPKLSFDQYLTAATNGWVIESALVTIPGTTTQVDAMTNALTRDFFDEACETDDATIFTTDGKYTVANNTKCDADEGDPVDEGTWSLNADKTILTLDSSSKDPYTLTDISADADHIKGNITNFLGFSINATVTFKKK